MSRAHPKRPLGVGAGAMLMLVTSCRPSPPSEMARCWQGDLESCERACAQGTTAHDGCFRAASLIREQSRDRPLDTSERGRLVDVLAQACTAGFARACDDAVQTLTAPSIPPPEVFAPDREPRRSYPVIGDGSLERRRVLLERGCQLEPARCEPLGKALLGVDRHRATAALERACATQRDARACREAAQHLVAEAEADRILCDQGKPYGCARLARLLHEHDRARVTRVVTRECALRALPPGVPCLWMAMERASRLAPGAGFGAAGIRSAPTEEAFQKVMAQAKVEVGPATGISEERARQLAATRGQALRDCYGDGLRRNPKVQGRVEAEFTVDATGHPWDLRMGPSDLPDARVVHCVVELLDDEHFDAKLGTFVRVPFVLTPD